MFLERGFDAVKVADVARACGVTEKTVFNHFRSKESLLVDRWGELVESIRANLADPSIRVLDAIVATLATELDFLTEHGQASPEHLAAVSRFGRLVTSTPALADHRLRSQQQVTDTILVGLAERFETRDDDPRTQIIAEALSGLFTVFYRSLARHAPTQNAARCRQDVLSDLRIAADQLAKGVAP